MKDHPMPYIVGLLLLAVWVVINTSVLAGGIPFTDTPLSPKVGGEMVGRILGYMDAALLTYLTWLYQRPRMGGVRATDSASSSTPATGA